MQKPDARRSAGQGRSAARALFLPARIDHPPAAAPTSRPPVFRLSGPKLAAQSASVFIKFSHRQKSAPLPRRPPRGSHTKKRRTRRFIQSARSATLSCGERRKRFAHRRENDRSAPCRKDGRSRLHSGGRTKKRFARRRLAIFLRHSRLCFCARLPLFHPPIRRSLPVLACRCPQPSSHPPQTAPALRVPILHRRGRPPAPFLHRAPDMKKPSAQRNRSACTTPCRLPFLRAAAPLGIDPAAPHAKAQPQRADGAPPQIRPIRFTPCRARARFARYAPRKAAAYAGAAHPNRRRTLPAVRAAQARAGGRL